MFIKNLKIKNFRLFQADNYFEINGFNIPNGQKGSGINVFVGENACGKTTILDALTLPLLSYKAENFSLQDFNNPEEDLNIEVISAENFCYDGSMPKAKFKGKGFSFIANKRKIDNNKYLSNIIVSDQKFIKADGEEKPNDNSPDLRISVNNPYKGLRFNENEILLLDKNRTYQTRTGTYATTKFDRLMENFNYQYIKKNDEIEDLNLKFNENIDFLNNAIEKFNEMCGFKLSLSVLNNWMPYKKAFFNIKKDNHQQILLEDIGSGYETIFAIIYAFYMSKQTKKDLIILIDEPELHLHPQLQKKLVDLLIEIGKTSQIFLTSHSPLFVKQLFQIDNIYLQCIRNEDNKISIIPTDEKVLNYLSSNEVNFLAFGLATEEYHNELYNELENKFREKYTDGKYTQIIFDNNYFNKEKGEPIDSPFKGEENKVTKHTYIRNKIHHSKENGGLPNYEELKKSINFLRNCLKSN